ncbi:MAG TPA: WD40 repeat domain-containing protein [Actinospica sp.]|jgi:WD40 repeat protein|nr:WD40 repeat domain-containing protein [Actinospica sp.]
MPHLPTTFVHEFKSPAAFSTAGTAVALAFGADNRLLATGGEGATVDLWDALEARQLAALSGHQSSKLMNTVLSLAFSPDGQLLASGGHDKTVRLWSAANGECVNVLSGFSGGVHRLAFHPTARILAAADEDAVRLFDLGSGAVLPIPLPEGGINGIAFSPNGSMLAVAPGGKAKRGGHAIALVDPATGQTLRTIGGDDFPARGIAFSPDGRTLAAAPREGAKIWLYDTASWQLTRTLKAPSYVVNDLAFSSQGALGAAIDDRVSLWDLATDDKPAAAKVPFRRNSEVETLAFSPDGQLLATCRRGKSVHIYR